MKKITLIFGLLFLSVLCVQAQSNKNEAAHAKAAFTPSEEAKLQYISKQQDMAANYYRNNKADAEKYLTEVISKMEEYISNPPNPSKLEEMKQTLQTVKEKSTDFDKNFNEIYKNTKYFMIFL